MITTNIFDITKEELRKIGTKSRFGTSRMDFIIKGIKKPNSTFVKKFKTSGLNLGSRLTILSALGYSNYSVFVDGFPLFEDKNINLRSVDNIIDAFELERTYSQTEEILPYIRRDYNKYSIDSLKRVVISRYVNQQRPILCILFHIPTKNLVKTVLQAEVVPPTNGTTLGFIDKSNNIIDYYNKDYYVVHKE